MAIYTVGAEMGGKLQAASKQLFCLVSHIIFRKISTPIRSKKWEGKKTIFQHRGAKNLLFVLYPGEYIDRFIYVEGIYEKRFLNFIEKIFTETDVMLDVGANIGNHAMYLSNVFRLIHSFEPNPRAIDRINRNIAINHIRNIIVHPVGLGRENDSLPFVENFDGNLGCSHFQEQKTSDSILLSVKNGDRYISKHNIDNIDYIKIDVEGFELDVLKGLRNTIESQLPIISFEYHQQNFEANYFDGFKTALNEYTFFELVFASEKANFLEKTKINFKMGGMPELCSFDKPENRTYENILAVPTKKLDSLLSKLKQM